jgi:hypothetical protein
VTCREIPSIGPPELVSRTRCCGRFCWTTITSGTYQFQHVCRAGFLKVSYYNHVTLIKVQIPRAANLLELVCTRMNCRPAEPTAAACERDEFRRSYRGDFAAGHWERSNRGCTFLAKKWARGTGLPACRFSMALVLKQSKFERANRSNQSLETEVNQVQNAEGKHSGAAHCDT